MRAVMEKQLLIFDLDGTLADTRADLATGINLMRDHYALSRLDLQSVSRYIGGGIRNLVVNALEGAPVDIEEAFVLMKTFYADHLLDQTKLYPGVMDGLVTLSAAGHMLAVLSNKPGPETRRIVDHLGVGEMFFRVIGGGDVPQLKPATDGVDVLMATSGVHVEKVWMIGDHHTDLAVAHCAGVRSGFVTYGIGHPGEFIADQIWHGFDELVRFYTNK